MNRQYIDELVKELGAQALVARLAETGFSDLIEPLLLYISTDPRLSAEEQREKLGDMAALDEKHFERECRASQTTYGLIEKDALTRLYNRRKLDLDLGIVIAGVQRSQYGIEGAGAAAGATFILLDIDNFKQINDTYGHPYGDTVLQEVAKSLLHSVRTSDSQRVYRYGGEEIAVLLFPCMPESAYAVGERLRENLNKHAKEAQICDGNGITASFGISTTETALDAATLIQQADNAMYFAKRSGRNRVELYHPI